MSSWISAEEPLSNQDNPAEPPPSYTSDSDESGDTLPSQGGDDFSRLNGTESDIEAQYTDSGFTHAGVIEELWAETHKILRRERAIVMREFNAVTWEQTHSLELCVSCLGMQTWTEIEQWRRGILDRMEYLDDRDKKVRRREKKLERRGFLVEDLLMNDRGLRRRGYGTMTIQADPTVSSPSDAKSCFEEAQGDAEGVQCLLWMAIFFFAVGSACIYDFRWVPCKTMMGTYFLAFYSCSLTAFLVVFWRKLAEENFKGSPRSKLAKFFFVLVHGTMYPAAVLAVPFWIIRWSHACWKDSGAVCGAGVL